MKKLAIILLVSIVTIVVACKKEDSNTVPPPSTDTLIPYTLSVPYNFPAPVVPDDNKPYVQRIALGRRLYYDNILSNDGRSCSTCHLQSQGFTSSTGTATPVLPHVNLAWNTNFMWDGSKPGTLENVMLFEVQGFFQTDIAKVNRDSTYRSLFKKYYNADSITAKNLAYALAQFMRTLTSANTKYELVKQHLAKFTPEEEEGYRIFFSEIGDCFHCHTSYVMTDNSFHNTGLNDDYSNDMDKGLYNVTGLTTDMGKFKTPNLRNCALRTRFMHDGRFSTLEQVIEHYNSEVKLSAQNIDPIMTKPGKENGLRLTDQNKKDLVAFLRTLTDSVFISSPQLSKPY